MSLANITQLEPFNLDSTANYAFANLTLTGNVTASYFVGNGSLLTGLPASYTNSNVATFLASFGSNTITTTGNITVGNLVTSGSGGNISGANVVTANTLVASSGANFISASNVSLGAVANIHITGGTTGQYLKTDGTGNLSWATVSGGGGGGASVTVSDTAPATPSQGDLWLDSDSGELNVYYSGAWGSVTETAPQFVSTVNSFVGDSLTSSFTLTTAPIGIDYTLVAIGGILQPRNTYTISGNVLTTSSAVPSNTPVEVTILSGQATSIGVAATVTSASQPNITSVGTLNSLTLAGNGTVTGNLSVTGNVAVTGNLSVNGAPPATTGKSIAMAIVFGF